jgi:hypothetical protein
LSRPSASLRGRRRLRSANRRDLPCGFRGRLHRPGRPEPARRDRGRPERLGAGLPNTRCHMRAGPDTLAMGRDMSKKTTISIVTRALQPVFWAQLLPCRRSRPRAPFAKLWRLAREFLCCELQNGMILPVCNLQRL